jgi:uncharacterized protein YwgA
MAKEGKRPTAWSSIGACDGARISYSSRCALVVDLVKRLRDRGSWCGETHLQKALFILQDISNSNFGYKFVIYKHGPYSFELNNELTAMRAANILEFQFPKEGYGPSICATSFGERVYKANEENIKGYFSMNKFLAEWFAASDVRHLEKVATAYYVTKKNPRDPAIERARKLNSLKPHVDIRAAEEAVRIVDEKRKEAKVQLGAVTA